MIKRLITESPNWVREMLGKSRRIFQAKSNIFQLMLSSSKEDFLDILESFNAFTFLTYVFGTNSQLLSLFVNDMISSEELSFVLKNFKMPSASYMQASFSPSENVKKTLSNAGVPYFGLALIRLSNQLSASPKNRIMILDFIRRKNELSKESDVVTSFFVITLSSNFDEVMFGIDEAIFEDNAVIYLDSIWEETRDMVIAAYSQNILNGDINSQHANKKIADFISSNKPSSYLKSFFYDIWEKTFNMITKGSIDDF